MNIKITNNLIIFNITNIINKYSKNIQMIITKKNK